MTCRARGCQRTIEAPAWVIAASCRRLVRPVPRARLELALPREADFKSAASAGSATWATPVGDCNGASCAAFAADLSERRVAIWGSDSLLFRAPNMRNRWRLVSPFDGCQEVFFLGSRVSGRGPRRLLTEEGLHLDRACPGGAELRCCAGSQVVDPEPRKARRLSDLAPAPPNPVVVTRSSGVIGVREQVRAWRSC